MSGPADVPTGSHAVVDSSVLFAMGGPENEKYRAFRRFVDRRELSVRIPEAVAEELGESPDAYAYQRGTGSERHRKPGGSGAGRSTTAIRTSRRSWTERGSGWRAVRRRTSTKTT